MTAEKAKAIAKKLKTMVLCWVLLNVVVVLLLWLWFSTHQDNPDPTTVFGWCLYSIMVVWLGLTVGTVSALVFWGPALVVRRLLDRKPPNTS